LGAAEAIATGRAFALGDDILSGGYQCKVHTCPQGTTFLVGQPRHVYWICPSPFVVPPNTLCQTQLSGSKYQSCFNWTVVGPSSCNVNALREEARREAQLFPQYSLDCSSPVTCVEMEESRNQPKVRYAPGFESIVLRHSNDQFTITFFAPFNAQDSLRY
jgi:hypothetical protein